MSTTNCPHCGTSLNIVADQPKHDLLPPNPGPFEKLFVALKLAGEHGLSRKQINHGVFNRHLKSSVIASTLRDMLDHGYATCRVERNPIGRPTEVWYFAG
jgi:hypothetical protein